MRADVPERAEELPQPTLERPECVEELLETPDLHPERMPEDVEQKGVHEPRELREAVPLLASPERTEIERS